MTYLQGHSKVKQVPVSRGWKVGLRFTGGLLAVTLSCTSLLVALFASGSAHQELC